MTHKSIQITVERPQVPYTHNIIDDWQGTIRIDDTIVYNRYAILLADCIEDIIDYLMDEDYPNWRTADIRVDDMDGFWQAVSEYLD